jgi:processive 1,2-diacylglycerol beta-glucosyltransferase
MAAADICLSKPGGLSSTELLAIGLPSVLVLVVPGCESRNMDFITGLGLAVGSEDWEEATERALELLDVPEKLMDMRRQLAELEAGYGAKNVVDFIENALKNE